MRRATALAAATILVSACAPVQKEQPVAAPAQQPVAPSKTPPPTVGAMAPDFTLPGATKYGVLGKAASLSDYRGKTVVLAFFFRARTKG